MEIMKRRGHYMVVSYFRVFPVYESLNESFHDQGAHFTRDVIVDV